MEEIVIAASKQAFDAVKPGISLSLSSKNWPVALSEADQNWIFSAIHDEIKEQITSQLSEINTNFINELIRLNLELAQARGRRD